MAYFENMFRHDYFWSNVKQFSMQVQYIMQGNLRQWVFWYVFSDFSLINLRYTVNEKLLFKSITISQFIQTKKSTSLLGKCKVN